MLESNVNCRGAGQVVGLGASAKASRKLKAEVDKIKSEKLEAALLESGASVPRARVDWLDG